MSYAVDLPECCKAQFDGRNDVGLYINVSVEVNFQVSDEADQCDRCIVNTNMSGGDKMLTLRENHHMTSVFAGLSSNWFAIIRDDISSTQVDICPDICPQGLTADVGRQNL